MCFTEECNSRGRGGNVHDSMSWKWVANGEYSTKTAYQIQFQGSFTPFRIGKLWKAKTEAKAKLFGWTAMHQKIPTAEMLAARGMLVSSGCVLCNSGDENTHHLLTECSFSRQVLHFIWTWCDLSGGPSQGAQTPGTAAWLMSNAASVNV
jgi:hypothetical protein